MDVSISNQIKKVGISRLGHIDIIKGFAILLILLGHLLNAGSPLKQMIYVVNVPAFFIASGIVCKPRSVKDSISSKFSSLLIPYLLWALIYVSPSVRNIAYIMYGSNQSLLNSGGNGMLWFIPVMFISSVFVSWFLCRIESKKLINFYKTAAILLLIVIGNCLHFFSYRFTAVEHFGLPFGIDIAFLAAAMIIFGTMLRKWPVNSVSVNLLCSVLFFVVVLGTFIKTNSGYPRMATGDLNNWFLYFLLSSAACLGLLSISVICSKISMLGKALSWFGYNSMSIYAVHKFFRDNVLLRFFGAAEGGLELAIYFALLVIMSAAAAFFLGRYFPFLVGMKQQTKANKAHSAPQI